MPGSLLNNTISAVAEVTYYVIVVRLEEIITVQGTFLRVGSVPACLSCLGHSCPRLGGRCGVVNLVWAPSPVEVECVVPSLSSVGSLVSVAASDRGSAARADLLPDVKH